MVIIPVLDLLDGAVVRGVAGRRESYAPVQSTIVSSPDPLQVATAFREHFGLKRLYLADLNAIMANSPQCPILEALVDARFDLLVDAGIWNTAEAERLVSIGVGSIVVALETLPDPSLLAELVSEFGPERIVFSLDLMHGRPLGNVAAWGNADSFTIGQQALDVGVTSLLVLDLSAVGISGGVPTLELCQALHRASPGSAIIAGGGVRGLPDLLEMRSRGVDAALVASALHDGRVRSDDLAFLN